MNYSKFRQYDEALKYYKKLLNEVVEEATTVNSDYQKYLNANPHKKKKKALQGQRKKLTKQILDLVETKFEDYKPK